MLLLSLEKPAKKVGPSFGLLLSLPSPPWIFTQSLNTLAQTPMPRDLGD